MRKALRFISIFVSVMILAFALEMGVALAQEQAPESDGESFPQFKSNIQGFLSYSQFETFESIQSKSPFWKKQADLNLLELKGEYYISRKTELEFEIEIEHGGTGSTIEFDPMEEFGEFESEQEKGGEVVLSEIYYRHMIAPLTWVRVGKIPIYISLTNVQESSLRYPSVLSSLAEPNMLPVEWRDIGVELQKRMGSFSARASLTNGLNSEFFRKYNWVGGGYQRQFETVNADSLAATVSFELGDLVLDDGVALAAYHGDTSSNRNKRGRLDSDANLTVVSLFGSWHFLERFGVRGQVIRGQLDNSDRVATANSTLPGLGNPKAFSSIGHRANLEMLELSCRQPLSDTSSLTGFVSAEHVDTMADVEGVIVKDDRYNQLFISVGLMWTWQTVMYLKGAYSKRSTSLDGLPNTDAYQLAFGFDFQGYSF
jgi:hypothetical protein